MMEGEGEREFTEAQLRWACFIVRNTNLDDDKVVQLCRAGKGLLWPAEEDGDG